MRSLTVIVLLCCAGVTVADDAHANFATTFDYFRDAGLDLNDDFTEVTLVQSEAAPRGRPPARRQPELATRRPRRPSRRRSGVLARVPGMFGDFFGGGRPIAGQPGANHGRSPPRGGAGTRQVKLAENYSPLPRNRLFGSYHFFNDPLDGSFGDVNRYTAGFESTYLDESGSIDVRLPIASTLSSDQGVGPVLGKDTEVGNLTITLKQSLASTDSTLLAMGVGIALPTADDVRVFRPPGGPPGPRLILEVENEAVHFLPFVGYVETHEQFFLQAFAQLDIDANGNSVRGDPASLALMPLGVVQDPTLLFLDVSFGFWAYENPAAHLITAIAPIVEFHYSTTLQDSDLIDRMGFRVGDESNRFDALSVTGGAQIELANRWLIRPGIVVPMRGGDDRQFDFEAFVQANLPY